MVRHDATAVGIGLGGAWIAAGVLALLFPQRAQATPDHDYPRIGYFSFARSPPAWSALFDLVVTGRSSTEYAAAAKAINPDVLFVATRDWQYGAGLTELPSEWIVRNSVGEAVTVYAGAYRLLDHSNFCPPAPSRGGLRYNEFIPEWMSGLVDLTVFDGVATDGVVERPRGTGSTDVDLDRNCPANGGSGAVDTCNDWIEHDRAWLEGHWLAGIHEATAELRRRIGNDKIILFNSGRFHEFEWDTTNGLYLEHESMTVYFDRFRDAYDRWTARAPEPHVLLLGANRAWSRTEFHVWRYFLGLALYGDAYFEAADHESDEHHYVYYLDEYDVPLGRPTGPMRQVISTGDHDRGVWARFFTGGAVLVNVDDHPNEVTDEALRALAGYAGPYHRFHGGQDPEHNNGAPFDRVTLVGRTRNEGFVGDGILLLAEPAAVVADIFVDNVLKVTSPGSQPGQFEGGWTQASDRDSAWTPGARGYAGIHDYAWAPAGGGEARAEYRPTIGLPGTYEVFEWHPSRGEAPPATNVPYTVTHAGGISEGTIDQTRDPGRWNSLGSFDFAAGEAGGVTLTNAADGVVSADAFRFVYVERCEPGAVESCITAAACPGIRTCGDAGEWGDCLPRPGGVETCGDGIDNDCNGVADDPAVCGVPDCEFRMSITADNSYEVYLDGTLLGADETWSDAELYAATLGPGRHVVAVHALNPDAPDPENPAGVLVAGEFCRGTFHSDSSWLAEPTGPDGWREIDFDDTGWAGATEIAEYGGGVWGRYHGGVVDGFPAGTAARWIWLDTTTGDQHAYFRMAFRVDGVPAGDAGTDAATDASGDAAGEADIDAAGANGCSCRAPGGAGSTSGGHSLLLFALLAFVVGRAKRSRSAGPRVKPSGADRDVSRRWSRGGTVVLVLALVGLPAEAAAWPEHAWPRTGGLQWGGGPPEFYARFDLVVSSMTSADFARRVKAINPSIAWIATRDINGGVGAGGIPEEWYVRKANGEVFRIYGNSVPLHDVTDFCPLVGGARYSDFVPRFMTAELVDLTVFDGLATDGMWSELGDWLPGIREIDLDRDGIADYDQHGGIGWINGHWSRGGAKILTAIRDGLAADKVFLIQGGDFPTLRDRFNGHLFEYGGGFGASWYDAFGFYADLMGTLRNPQANCIDAATRWGGVPEEVSTRNEFGFLRFALGTAMLGNGYLDYQPLYKDHYFWAYFDEFALDLGRPTGGVQMLSCSPRPDWGDQCVFVRFFDQGAVVVNVTGSPQTIRDEDLAGLPGYAGPYHRFRGGQDPAWNDGREIGTATLGGSFTGPKQYRGDALILVSTPRTVVSDIVVDNTEMITSPGSEPAVFEPFLEERTVPATDGWNPSCGAGGWCSGCPEWIRGYCQATAPAGDGARRAIFRPTIGVAGTYEVFEWHGGVDGAATNVPYTLTHAGGEASGTIDQSDPDLRSRWNTLGIFAFEAGSEVGITITNDADGTVVADAFQWVYLGCEAGQSHPCVTSARCTGVERCTAAGTWGACESSPAGAEVCGDGLDNDCNGIVDDPAACGVPDCDFRMSITADGSYEVYLDGTLLGADDDWVRAEPYGATLEPGRHVIAVHAYNSGVTEPENPAGVLVDGSFCRGTFHSDSSWLAGPIGPDGWQGSGFDASDWTGATAIAEYGGGVWARHNGGVVEGFPVGTAARWIWLDTTTGDQHAYFRMAFHVDGVPADDAGTDAATDASGDAGLDEGGASGCSCRTTAGSRPAPHGCALLLLVTLALVVRRTGRCRAEPRLQREPATEPPRAQPVRPEAGRRAVEQRLDGLETHVPPPAPHADERFLHDLLRVGDVANAGGKRGRLVYYSRNPSYRAHKLPDSRPLPNRGLQPAAGATSGAAPWPRRDSAGLPPSRDSAALPPSRARFGRGTRPFLRLGCGRQPAP